MLQASPARPRLVVGIVVDQLRTDYIEYLQGLFGEKGFRKLMREGVYLKDMDFGVDRLDIASGTAMVFTGNYPSASGVTGSRVYDPATGQSRPVLNDPASIGNYTNDTYSPASLRLSTISDEVAVDGVGFNAIYSIAPDAQQAIIMAGHAGNSAFWLNENTGQWATTTYYKDVPQVINTRNYGSSVASRIDNMRWKPMLPAASYPGLPAQKRLVDFNHSFPRSDKDVYRMFSSTPLANDEVTDLAIDYLKELHLGSRGDVMDMLNIGYTAAPYKYGRDNDNRAELADTYVRLDAQLGRLFDALDQYVGRDNVVVFLSGTGYFDDAMPDDPRYRLPGGDFSMKRAMSLLNSYLTARHGNGNYVSAFIGNELFLDRDAIEAARLDIEELARESRDFLCRMSGVNTAYTMRDVLEGGSPELVALRRSLDPKVSGDIFVEFAPGWAVVDDLHFPTVSKQTRLSPALTPGFIWAPYVEAMEVASPVDATAFAPTVSGILRIRAPNGSASSPLSVKFRQPTQ